MSIMRERTCVECGKEFMYETQNNRRLRNYCSVECANASNRHRRKSSGMMTCSNCGKAFTSVRKVPRKCCSKICAIADIHRKMHDGQNKGSGKNFRKWIVSLCTGGYGCTATAEALGISRLTLEHWTKEYKDFGSISGKYIPYSFHGAKSPQEWLRTLRTESYDAGCAATFINGDRRIFLVCGKTKVWSGVNQLAVIVEAHMQKNPYDGSIYVFCSTKLDRLSCLYWDGAGLILVKRRSEYGKYPWPSSELGCCIEVTREDLGLVMSGRCKKPEKA